MVFAHAVNPQPPRRASLDLRCYLPTSSAYSLPRNGSVLARRFRGTLTGCRIKSRLAHLSGTQSPAAHSYSIGSRLSSVNQSFGCATNPKYTFPVQRIAISEH